ncbi:MAG: SDR family oxidoreductase [Betaproteobacteria bacterium]|nr:SDR family oxidoreductase [Betaproteobacteria bacterium]
MTGRTCVVTGATRGIGRPTAEALARMGATVVVHGRDSAAVGAVCRELTRSSGNSRVTGVVADLSSLADVRRLAREIAARHERLDVLVNNAGLGAIRRNTTADGYEWVFAVNHLAPFLLTNLLLEQLAASAPARVVTVSSMAYRRAVLDLDDPNWERRKYNGLQAYGASKLANILFTIELARRLEGRGVTANCLHPGGVATNIFNNMGFFGRAFSVLARPLLLSATAGAATSVYLASSPEVANVSAKFFDKCKETALTPAAQDRAAAQRLWEISERLTALGQ